MPILLIPLVVLAVLVGGFLLVVLLIPLGIVQRYRVGTSRRKARGCVALGNTIAFAISAALLLATAVVTSLWEPAALPYVAAGFAGGAALGWLGLALSRWEETGDGLYLTPRRWLVLAIVLVVAARMAYGLWRAGHAIAAGLADGAWLARAGVAGSLAAGAVVIGYSLVYSLGVRRRVEGYRKRMAHRSS